MPLTIAWQTSNLCGEDHSLIEKTQIYVLSVEQVN